jgi:hypothetical protein
MTAKLPPMPAADVTHDRTGHPLLCGPCFTLSQLQADRLAVWNAAIRAAAKAVPTNWLDSLLTGKDGIGQPPYDARDIEQLLRGVQDAIRLLEETN